MKSLSKAAAAVMDILTRGLNPGGHRRIDNCEGAFMPVCVENIGQTELGPLFSVAHYYEQNSDLMRDPEMVFLKRDGKYHPVSFQQDGGLGFYQQAIHIHGIRVIGYRPPLLDEQVAFAGIWMKNTKNSRSWAKKTTSSNQTPRGDMTLSPLVREGCIPSIISQGGDDETEARKPLFNRGS